MEHPPSDGDDWIGIGTAPLPVGTAPEWVVQARCGAVVCFVGTVRDHADGREGVVALEYEAFVERVVERMDSIAAAARRRWPELGRVVILHRIGRLEVGEASVVVAVSSPHRQEAFAAASYCIDTLKTAVPIWKKEFWSGGSDWGTRAVAPDEVRIATSHE